MATARQPRSSPPAAHDFVARIASWRTSPSTSDYSPIASAEEPLLARTDAGWSRTPTEDARATKGSSRSTLSEAGGPSTHSTTHTRRWLVGCFAVILLAGSGWRISTNGNADLGRPAEVWNAAHESLPASSSTTVQGGHHALHGEQAEIAADLEDSWESPQSEGTTAPAATASPTAIVSPASETAPSRAPAWNVHPRPRPPTADLHAKSTTKYLAYENHSGFHNQRKSLVNALVLAQLLNRTLLLPPARLGHAMPWEPDPKHTVVFSERCKVGLEPDKPAVTNPKSHLIGLGEACDPSTGWTYVGWDYLIEPDLLRDHALVDRWNSSAEWLTSTTGGLGLATADIHTFEDTARRSYQILDSRNTAHDGTFESRLELDDLRDPAGIGSKRLLRFGSLFSGSRLKLVDPKNKALHDETSAKMVLRNEGLDAISDSVRDALGSYVAVHARVGDGVFKSHASENMHRLFLNLCAEVFGLSKSVAEKLYKTSEPRRKRRPGLAHRTRQHRAQLVHPIPSLFVDYADIDEAREPEVDGASVPGNASPLFASEEADSDESMHLVRRKPLRGSPARPLAPHLRCRGKLHDPAESPHLARLNTPLYIATDSRRPTSDPNLAPFFRWFPCTFLLGDFSATGAANEVNDEPIAELVRLADAAKFRGQAKGSAPSRSQWTSDWDRTDLGHFLLPFLEAEIAARAVRVLGTHQSTFSGYTTTVLHDNYVENSLVAPVTRELDRLHDLGTGAWPAAGEQAKPSGRKRAPANAYSINQIQGVKPFIYKLRWLLRNPQEVGDVITWSNDGSAVLVKIGDADSRLKQVLMRTFSHENTESFARQLSAYGFARIKDPNAMGDTTQPAGVWRAYRDNSGTFRRERQDDVGALKRMDRSSKDKGKGTGSSKTTRVTKTEEGAGAAGSSRTPTGTSLATAMAGAACSTPQQGYRLPPTPSSRHSVPFSSTYAHYSQQRHQQ